MLQLSLRLGRDLMPMIFEFIPRLQYEWWVWERVDDRSLLEIQMELLKFRPSIVRNKTDHTLLFPGLSTTLHEPPSVPCAARILVLGTDLQRTQLLNCIPKKILADLFIEALYLGLSDFEFMECVTRHEVFYTKQSLLVSTIACMCSCKTLARVACFFNITCHHDTLLSILDNGCRDPLTLMWVLNQILAHRNFRVSLVNDIINIVDWRHITDSAITTICEKMCQSSELQRLFQEAVRRKDEHRATQIWNFMSSFGFPLQFFDNNHIAQIHHIDTCPTFVESQTLRYAIDRAFENFLFILLEEKYKLFFDCAEQALDALAQRLWNTFALDAKQMVCFGMYRCKFQKFLIDEWSILKHIVELSPVFFATLALRSSNATLWNLLRDTNMLPPETKSLVRALAPYITSPDFVLEDKYLDGNHEHIIAFALVFRNADIAKYVLSRYENPPQCFLKSSLQSFASNHIWQALDLIPLADDVDDIVFNSCYSIAIENNDCDVLRALWRLRPLTTSSCGAAMRAPILAAPLLTGYFFCQRGFMVREIATKYKNTLHQIAFDIDFVQESLFT